MKARLAALVALCSIAAPAWGGDLVVTLNGVAHAQGGMRVGLYDRPQTFRKEDQAVAVLAAPAQAGAVSVTFSQVPPGRYAIMAYHDEDGDGGLDRFMGMIPTEGYGLSNDPEVTGPPAFEECAFDMPAEGRTLPITLKY